MHETALYPPPPPLFKIGIVGSEIIYFMKLTPDKAKTQEFTDTMQ